MDRLVKVLIIEDSVADAEIDVLTLESGGLAVQSRRVDTEMEYLLALRDAPDVVLSDHSMPAFDSQRALKILRTQGNDIPFIVVSGHIGEAAVVDLMRAGANDFVHKDNLARLAPAVRRELEALEERRRSRATEEKLQRDGGSLDTLMHNLPGMIYRLVQDSGAWRFEFVSEGCKDLTGYDRETLAGVDGLELTRLLYGDEEAGELDEILHTLDSEGYFTLEHRLRCANGDVKWVWHRGAVIRDRGGRARHVEGFLADVTAQKVNQAKLDYLAHHDALTGLANRTEFEEQLARCLERAKRHFQSVTLLFIDLDDFKAVNDSWGHQSGDAVLRAIAGRLTACCRKGDMVARLGGDEFALVLDDDEKAEDVAQAVPRILEEVARPLRYQEREISVTASIGIAVFPTDGEDAATLLKNADAAMYAAKENGGGTFRFFANKMNERARSMVVMRKALHKALRHQDFELHFQPEVRLSDRRIVGVESLARWRRASDKVMTADHFIPFARDAGVVAAIDRWTVQSACRQAQEWSAAGLPFGRITCNLSVQALADRKFAGQLQEDMQEYAVSPDWLGIEIDQTVLAQDMIATRVTLEKLAEQGLKITLDDFGMGSSSLNDLTRFPVDRLKLARAFVKNVPWKDEDVQLCRAILAMAESLHLEVSAVGIEQREQEIFLHHAGCGVGQGFLFSPALPYDECARLLSEGYCSADVIHSLPEDELDLDVTGRLLL
jgi:diguanylate cyclase (GGDEF)-like protein/PAS domain S-box-containing protein